MFTLLSTLVSPAHADELQCVDTQPANIEMVPSEGTTVARQIDGLVRVRSLTACPVEVVILDDAEVVRAEITIDPRVDRFGVLHSVELEPGPHRIVALGSDSGDVLQDLSFTVADQLRDDPPTAPEGVLSASSVGVGLTSVDMRFDTFEPGLILSVMGPGLDAVEPVAERFDADVDGLEIGDELCVDVAFRTAASDFTEAVEVCTIVEEDTYQGGDQGSPLPSIRCGCSLASAPASGGFLGLALLGLLLRRVGAPRAPRCQVRPVTTFQKVVTRRT